MRPAFRRLARAAVASLALLAGGCGCADVVCDVCDFGAFGVRVRDAVDSRAITAATVAAAGEGCSLDESVTSAYFRCPAEAGAVEVMVAADGYQPTSRSVLVQEGGDGCCSCGPFADDVTVVLDPL